MLVDLNAIGPLPLGLHALFIPDAAPDAVGLNDQDVQAHPTAAVRARGRARLLDVVLIEVVKLEIHAWPEPVVVGHAALRALDEDVLRRATHVRCSAAEGAR